MRVCARFCSRALDRHAISGTCSTSNSVCVCARAHTCTLLLRMFTAHKSLLGPCEFETCCTQGDLPVCADCLVRHPLARAKSCARANASKRLRALVSFLQPEARPIHLCAWLVCELLRAPLAGSTAKQNAREGSTRMRTTYD